MIQSSLKLMNCWVLPHTHSEAYPSETDQRLAFYPDARYLLLSLQDREAPVLRSFRIEDGAVTEEELSIA